MSSRWNSGNAIKNFSWGFALTRRRLINPTPDKSSRTGQGGFQAPFAGKVPEGKGENEMTKQMFAKTAALLQNANAAGNLNDAGLRNLAEAFAEVFAEKNTRFNREKFLTACGVGESDHA
jgi:hypothetical protein